MIYFIGLLCSCTVTGFVLFEIAGTLYEKKYPEKNLIYSLALTVYIVLSIAVACIHIPILNLGYSTLALCILTFGLYKAQGKNMIINSGITIIYLASVDMIVTTVFSTAVNSSTYNTLQNPKYFLLSAIGNAIVILCTNRLIIEVLLRCRISKLAKILHIYMMFLMVFEFGILYYFIQNDMKKEHNIPLLLMSVGFIVLDAGIIYLYKMISQNSFLEKKTELIEQQLEMTVKYYEGFQENYERTQKVLHDIKKHLQVLNDIRKVDRTTDEYANEILESLGKIQQQFQCGDKIICAIIWNKIQICEQLGIEFEINMQDILLDFMSKVDVTALFANLLDNAVEACQSSEMDKKVIILRIHRFKEYIVIKQSNTIGTLPILRDGNLISTKVGHMGLGMSILENLANKYCGNMNYEFTEEFFETKIILSSNNRT